LEAFHEMNRKGLLGHAYALTGPEGIGKKTLAHELARMLLCYESPEKAPCGMCNACKTLEAGSNPNLVRIAPKTQKILIEQIRVLIDDIGVKPPYGRKVYIIEDADRMTQQAQNCLLKTLEEPPAYAVIIMTVSHFASLLVTIRSRAAQIKLSRYTPQEIKQILELRASGNGYDSIIAFRRHWEKPLALAKCGFKALGRCSRFILIREKRATFSVKSIPFSEQGGHGDCLAIMEAVNGIRLCSER
jgi:DNA polymerase-3 subunit delta'